MIELNCPIARSLNAEPGCGVAITESPATILSRAMADTKRHFLGLNSSGRDLGRRESDESDESHCQSFVY